ncbi:MAG: FHA domain-containing protein [Candidatus Freyarchaeota archaeon]|nr:FHA domain-containing protein [Candidatus Jordarchaeia archaeon]MBS7270514.1 FHA domain-containing protein [Candidatus Jordarchaeia archaeon]MBS7281296.1 FHA domain-containing protein [Candidatus Jordarchaeia archaeon]
MVEGELRFEEVLGEIRAVMLSVPCPYCGFTPKGVVAVGEIVVCEGCGYSYTVERGLTEMGGEVIKRIVENVLGRFQVSVQGEISRSVVVFEEYANTVLEELRRCYRSSHRLPSREELDNMLLVYTESVLGSIFQAMETLRGDHQQIGLAVERVDRRVVSLSVKLENLVSILKHFLEIPREFWRTTILPHVRRPGGVSLIYCDFEGKECSIDIDEDNLREGVILGRETGWGWRIKVQVGGEARILRIGDSTVSRKHARILCHDNKIFVEDLNSKCGTYINGVKIELGGKAQLRNGDIVKIGVGTTFRVSMR